MVEVWRHERGHRKYYSGISGSGTQYKLLPEKDSERIN
jgi:hypothetical protein